MPRYFRAPPRIPTRADIDAVLRVTDADDHARDHLLVAVAAGTGLRVHEVVALDWGQLVSEPGAIRHRVHLRAEDTNDRDPKTWTPAARTASAHHAAGHH